MSELATEHRGYKIVYSENQDLWSCMDLSFDAPTLSKLKDKISRHIQKLAKTSERIPVIKVERDSARVAEAVVTSLAKPVFETDYNAPKVEGKYGSMEFPRIEIAQVWVSFDPSVQSRQGRTRQTVKVNEIMLDTPENREALKPYAELVAEKKSLEARMRAARAALPWITAEEVKSRIGGAIDEGDGT